MKAIDEGIVITMPRAIGITEAHFIAVVGGTPPPPRYFLCENSTGGTSRFCEWVEDRHVNYAEVEASLEAFLTAMRTRLHA
jgi:hypothetical protein